MSLAEVRGLLDALAEEGCLVLTLSGGEVLLRRDFFEVAGAARERGFAPRIFTNGTLVDEARADRLAALEPVVVEMSLLGAAPETHDAITLKRGSFARTVRAAELLGARRPGQAQDDPDASQPGRGGRDGIAGRQTLVRSTRSRS